MKKVSVDIETYSAVDLTTAGVYRYATDPTFEILLIAYRVDDGEVVCLDVQRGDDVRGFLELLQSADCLKTAYNANFERTCLHCFFGVDCPPEQWQCTAVHAAMLGLPRSLGAVGKALGLPEDKQKDKDGKALISYFCKPCKPTKTNGGRTRNMPADAPESWERFKKYNIQDVVTESEIYDRLSIYPVPEAEWELWQLDQRANDEGVRVDVDLVNTILKYEPLYTRRLMDRAARLTGLDNPNSPAQLKKWLLERFGVSVDSLSKDAMEGLMETIRGLPGGAVGAEVLEIRKELGKTSTKKYAAMMQSVCADGRLRGVLLFYGAGRTGRWTGKIVQVHNLPQNKLPDLDEARHLVKSGEWEMLEVLYGGLPFVLSQLVRTAFIPSECCRFCVADFSAIEARVIAWLAGEEWRLEVFRTHGKIYEASAAQMFHVPLENIKKGSKLRQQGKVAELALGYGGAMGAIKAMDKAGSIPDEEIPGLVRQWRKASPKICRFWRDAETAARVAITQRRAAKLKNGITFSYVNGILFVKLPSGRKLAYYGAKVEEFGDGEHIVYMGTHQVSGAWTKIETWGGKLVENIVQATARDCLAETMRNVTAAGYHIVMHVHDEVIVDVPKEDRDALQKITAIMAREIPWARGLPLRGDGYEVDYYRKD